MKKVVEFGGPICSEFGGNRELGLKVTDIYICKTHNPGCQIIPEKEKTDDFVKIFKRFGEELIKEKTGYHLHIVCGDTEIIIGRKSYINEKDLHAVIWTGYRT